MGIDEGTAEVLVLGHVVAQHVEVDDHYADGLTHLGSSQSDTFTLGQCLPHILQQGRKFRIVGGNVLGDLAQYGLAIYINR